MKFKFQALVLFCLCSIVSCSINSAQKQVQVSGSNTEAIINSPNSQPTVSASAKTDANANKAVVNNSPSITQPKTVRDFFMLLPEKYFLLEGCERSKDKDCQKAKLDYLKTFGEIEDTANGYLKGGCDGAQSCLEMALFKRPDGKYLIALGVSQEMTDSYYFLDYENGNWKDVSAQIVPQFSRKYMYELPRNGTTVKVFTKKVLEKGDNYEISEKGEKLYDLEWKDGKFSIKK